MVSSMRAKSPDPRGYGAIGCVKGRVSCPEPATETAGSPCVPCRAKSRKKSDESQLATFDSVKPKRPPAHALVGSTVGHFPSAEAHNVAVVFLFIDEKMFRGAENLVNSLVAVFAAVSYTFKGSKNFSDHVFCRL